MRALFEPINTAPPWDWNPIGVGVEAFNATRRTALAQQAEQRLQEEAAIDNAIKRETMPYLAKKAQLEIQNLQADIGYRTALAERQRAEAASLNEERFGALEAGSSMTDLLGEDLYGRVFRRSATTSDPRPAPVGLNEMPVGTEPQQSFDLDAGAPIRLNSPSASSDNVLMNTFGKAAANPLDEFASSRAQVLGPGDTLAPIGSGGDVIESDQTYSTEDKNRVMESAAKTLQNRGGKSTNPLVSFNAPEPEPEAAPRQSGSSLSALFDDYQQADALLKSRASSATTRRDTGRIKGAAALVDQQFLSTAASEFGMGPTEFEALRKMDPVLRTKVEEYHRNSGGREGWAGSIDYVTAMSAERARAQVQRDLFGPQAPEAEDPEKVFDFRKKQADALMAQADIADRSQQFTRATLLREAANQRMLEVSNAPQISDQEVALAAYRNVASPDENVKTQALAELNTLLPRLEQKGYVHSLDGLTQAQKQEKIEDIVKGYPNVYSQMFVKEGAEVRPLAEFRAQLMRPAPTEETDSRAEPTEVKRVDVIADLEEQLAALDPNSPKAKALRTKLNEYRKGRQAADYLTSTVLPGVKEGMLKIVPPPDAWARAGSALLEGAKAIR